MARSARSSGRRGQGGTGRPAVFVDRDGVLNRSPVVSGKPVAPRTLKDFRLLPGAVSAIAALRRAGYLIVVVTNQPDVGHGLIDQATLDAMHRRLRERLAPDAIEICPHRQEEGCPCRKPKPGMLRRAARRLTINLQESYMIGDRWSDVEAGRAAGCYTILINRSYKSDQFSPPDSMVRSLAGAVEVIRQRRRAGASGGRQSNGPTGRAQD
jgi:D-glycero-D-manno-heptose 1,7-bisphosphate phosphatase